MFSILIVILLSVIIIEASHFSGGTITWAPVDPHTNSSTVVITITQTYSWVLSHVNCATNVPISTSTWRNQNLTCVYNCGNDGGYSLQPIDILTDCVSSSSSLDMMISRRLKSVTLRRDAFFSIGYRDGSWRTLDSYFGGVGGSWSIVSLIDIRRRPDGLINTPPVSNVASPQFVIINTTTYIRIPIHDINQGDHIRCRWAERNRLSSIDECNSICYPIGLPPGTNLSDDCVLTFTASRANEYYAISLQIEDFFNETSHTPMSSVPVQFLIYVLSAPRCSRIPFILPLTDCLEVQVGIPINLTLYAMNYCDQTQSILTDISISIRIPYMNISEMIHSTTNGSLTYRILTWIPEINQIGTQQLCATAYTSESVQSEEYCATFFVKNVSNFCQPLVTSTSITTDNDISTLISSEEIFLTSKQTEFTISTDEQTESTISTDEQTEFTISTDEQTESTISTDEQTESTISTSEQTESIVPASKQTEFTTSTGKQTESTVSASTKTETTRSNTSTFNNTPTTTSTKEATTTTTKLASESGLSELHLALIFTFSSFSLFCGLGCCCFGFYYIFYKRKHHDNLRK